MKHLCYMHFSDWISSSRNLMADHNTGDSWFGFGFCVCGMAAGAGVVCIPASVKLLEVSQCVYGEFHMQALSH